MKNANLFRRSSTRKLRGNQHCERASARRWLLMEALEDRRLLAVVWDRVEPLGSLIFRADVAGDIGGPVAVFSDDFESGSLSAAWSTSSSTPAGRVGVSNVLGAPANSGSFHLAMDTTVVGPNNLNEAILTIDLSGAAGVGLKFAHQDVNDEDTALPATFVGSFAGDGVSISDDGATWHTLVSLNNANSANNVYTDFSFDLDAEAAAAGISLGSNFQIKFQQFDNFPFNSDGRTFDDVAITAAGPLSETTTAFLEADQTLTVVATPADSSVTLTATVRDPSNLVIATGTASGPGETIDLQTIGIAVDGDYTVEISGDAASDYDLLLYRNATVEVVDTDDGAEQDASVSFISLGSGRFGIVGMFDGGDGGGEEEDERPIVWGIQPNTGNILKIDPLTGSIVGSFPAPDGLNSAHRINGLSIAEEGNTLIYVNGGVNGNNLYRLDPDDGTVLSVEFLPGFGGNRGGLSFETEGPDSIFAIDDGGPVDRQAGFGGPLADWTPGGADFPGALGGDDNGRLFLFRLNEIQEFSTTVANTQLNAFPLPPGSQGVLGLAFDGVNLYLSDATGKLFTLDPDTGATVNEVIVAGGYLSGLGADIVSGGGTLQSGPIYTTQQDGTRLGTIDKATGAGTDIGLFGTSQTWAAAFDTDGSLYTTINGFSGNAILASVNQTTGAVTTIGSGLGTNLISLEVDSSGTMYGIGYDDQVLYEINKTTGAATAIGSTGISFNMDLAFDSAGVMYATVANNIWTVDTATGNSTFLGSFSGILSGMVMGIMFDETDTLFATAYVPNSPLYEIDVNTLAATVVGNTTFFSPHGGDILITSSGPVAPGRQAIVPAPTPDIYGDPGEPGRFPNGPSAIATVAPNELLVNGSFEDGNFNGWTTVTTGGPFQPWAVTGAGQGGGFGMLQTQPQDGSFVAWNGFDGGGPMEFQMYQDVAIPAGSTATLSWMDRVQWNFTLGGTATLPRLYDVEIRDPGTNAVLQNVFSFSTGTQATNPTGNTNWQTHSVDVSSFAGQTVRVFFREQIPQSGTGPAQIEFDAISLTEDTAGTTVETMYGSMGNGSTLNPGGLIIVDQTTGAGTLVSDPITPGGMPGLAYDSASDVLFGATNRTTGVGTSTLVRLDPDTGALLSTVGTITDGPAGPAFGVGDLAIQPGTGVLYGIRSNSDGGGGQLYTIDKTTAVATLVGNTFQGRGGGLGFAPDGTLYFAEFDQLHVLNPANASILSTVTIVGAAPDGLGIRPSDGTLFTTQAGGGSQLIHTLNPITGVATVLGTTGVGGASDLAFRVQTIGVGPDVDEYMLDLAGKSGQLIDIAFSTDVDEDNDTTLELLDTDGVTVLATGAAVSDNFDLGILEFQIPADGIYTLRVSSTGQGSYGIVITDPLVFDTEPNQPNDSPLRSLDVYDGALGFLGEGTAGGDIDLSLLTSFDSMTLADSGFIPPDPILAAGPASVVAMVNTDIAIHNKTTGAVIAQADLDGNGGFWATNNVVFDPWITYDPASERFFAIGIDVSTAGIGSSRVYLAVSTDATPTNLTTDWNKYIIDRTGTHTGTGGSTFPDYPKLGVDDDAIYITGNDFGILSGGFSHVSLFAIEKAPLLTGGPVNIVYDEVIGGAFSIHPVTVHDAGAPMYFAEAGFAGGSSITLHAITNVLTAPVRTTSTVGVANYAFPPDVPQQGAAPLDSVDARIMSGVVRDGSLWTAHAIQDLSVDAETVVRWYEFDVTGFPAGSATLVQSGNVDPGPGVHTWVAHVNVDNDGDMGIAFSISGASQFAGIGYTGRLATDPLGTTRPVETARAGDGPYSLFDSIGRNRWGDYSSLAVDPDGESFWLYNEYAGTGNTWRTFVGQFQVEPGAVASPNVDTYEITLAAGETIGLSTLTPFDDPLDSLNLLNPSLEILDPSGVSVAFDSSGGSDGKNAALPLFTAATSGVYKVIVAPEDDGAGEYVLSVNWAPVLIDLALSAGMIFENESVTLTGTYRDQNFDDAHMLVVDWDDANAPADSSFAVPAINSLSLGDTFNSTTDGAVLVVTALDLLTGTVSFEVTDHQYLDDGPAPGNGTSADSSTVTVTITDSGGLQSAPLDASPSVLVKNVAPTIDAVEVSATQGNKAMPGDAVTLAASFTDIGLLDRHEVLIQWDDATAASVFELEATADLSVGDVFASTSGDGSLLTITEVMAATGQVSFLVASHQFSTGGIFAITMTLSDDDTGLDEGGTQAWVTGLRIKDGVLQVIGSNTDDHVTINQQGNGLLKVHADFLQSGNFQTFNTAEVDKILAYLCEGDDHFTIAGSVNIPAIVHGDGGDDHLNAGGGPAVLLGGAGGDMLVGGSGFDILIGGLGTDRLVGGGGDDVLIGGSTNADDDDDSLMELIAVWSAIEDYDVRVAAIDQLLSVYDDEEEDKLTGGSGRDLFYDGLGDMLTDVAKKKDAETVL